MRNKLLWGMSILSTCAVLVISFWLPTSDKQEQTSPIIRYIEEINVSYVNRIQQSGIVVRDAGGAPIINQIPKQVTNSQLDVVRNDYIRGIDVSYVSFVEKKGGVYRYADGTPGDVFEILAQNGVNYVRLRLWNDPTEDCCDIADMVALAARADQAGLSILLDFHYSDSWADPSKQTKPAAWQGLNHEELKTAVYTYTYQAVNDLIQQGTPPEMVQIGNEITTGMLWDDGRVAPAEFDTEAQWTKLAGLIQAGIDGVKATGSTADIMIHIDRGGDNAGARWFFDNLLAQGVEFDVIGLSYYNYWHGSLADLQANLNDLAIRYDRDIVVVETAYPWTLDWYDWTHNLIGLPEQLLPEYEATEAAQAAFLQAVIQSVQSTSNGKGIGVFYWGGEWISTSTTDENGSGWENQALFGFDGRAVKALSVFSDRQAPPTISD